MKITVEFESMNEFERHMNLYHYPDMYPELYPNDNVDDNVDVIDGYEPGYVDDVEGGSEPMRTLLDLDATEGEISRYIDEVMPEATEEEKRRLIDDFVTMRGSFIELRRRYKHYTSDEEGLLLDMLNDGSMTVDEIAHSLCRTTAGIYSKSNKLGFTWNKDKHPVRKESV